MIRSIEWHDGRTPRSAGPAAARLFDDLVRLRGLGEARSLLDAAVRQTGRARQLWPERAGGPNYDATVEGLLLAAGAAVEDIARLAAGYRARAQVELTAALQRAS